MLRVTVLVIPSRQRMMCFRGTWFIIVYVPRAGTSPVPLISRDVAIEGLGRTERLIALPLAPLREAETPVTTSSRGMQSRVYARLLTTFRFFQHGRHASIAPYHLRGIHLSLVIFRAPLPLLPTSLAGRTTPLPAKMLPGDLRWPGSALRSGGQNRANRSKVP